MITNQADFIDTTTLFRRMRSWAPSGCGAMNRNCILHQMGGRPGIDPYGWKPARIHAAIDALMAEGSISEGGLVGNLYVTQSGIEKYDSPKGGDA